MGRTPTGYIPQVDGQVVNLGFYRKTSNFIPKELLQNYVSTDTEAVKLAVLTNNNAAVKTAYYKNPMAPVILDPDVVDGWPLSVEFNAFTDAAFLPSYPFRIKGKVKLAVGTRASKTDSTTGRITAAPAVSVIRAPVGAPVVPSAIADVQLGVNLGGASQVVSGFSFAAGKIQQFAKGKIFQLSSSDYYAWAFRAVNSNTIWKAAQVPIGGILITIAGYSFAAVNTAAGLSGNTALTSLERRTIVGGSSGVTALVQGDYVNGQVVFNSISGDFSAGETLRDQATNAIVGTFTSGSQRVLATLRLNTTYTAANSFLRELPRVHHQFNLIVHPEGDGDNYINTFNRTDAVRMAACTDVKLNIDIRGGYAAGVVSESCYKVTGWIGCKALPNHALEPQNADGSQNQALVEGAYGYVFRSLGSTEEVDLTIDAEWARHAYTTNGSSGTYGLNDRTGSADATGVLTTNMWKYGPGARNHRLRINARAMYGQSCDTHEGCEDIFFEKPKIIQPFGAGRTITGPDGIVMRGYNITVFEPYLDGVNNGIADGGGAIDSGGLNFTNRVIGGVVKNFQGVGYSQGGDVHANNVGTAHFEVIGTVFRADPTIDVNFSQTIGMKLYAGLTKTLNVMIGGTNYADIIHSSNGNTTGHVTHINPIFDHTDSSANSIIRDEKTQDFDLIGAVGIFNSASTIPLAWIRSFSGSASKIRYKDLSPVLLGTATEPARWELRSGSTSTLVPLVGNTELTLVPPGGTTGQVLSKVSGADYDDAWVTPSTGSAYAPNIQVFTASGTWTKPASGSLVRAICVAGGHGGGGGGRNASGSVTGGGGGGSSSSATSTTIPFSAPAATETVTVGSGGAGGAGSTANAGSASGGTTGGLSSFGAWLRAQGGNPGSGAIGGGAGAGGGASNSGSQFTGVAGGGGGAGAVGVTIASVGSGLGAGAGGGGVSTTPTGFAGGNATTPGNLGINPSGGAVGGGAGTPGTASSAYEMTFGGGGAGGGGNAAGVGGAGGNGGFPGGSGGGGGGGIAANGGKGGDGAGGLVVVIVT